MSINATECSVATGAAVAANIMLPPSRDEVKKVAYHDAIHTKKNTVELSLYNLFGGAAPGATKRMLALSKRTTDRTEYESWAASEFVPYWTQRVSVSVVTADARRCLKRLPGLKLRAMADPSTGRARARPRPNGHPGRGA